LISCHLLFDCQFYDSSIIPSIPLFFGIIGDKSFFYYARVFVGRRSTAISRRSYVEAGEREEAEEEEEEKKDLRLWGKGPEKEAAKDDVVEEEN